jgi:phosphate transport system ATP-binding protein
MDEPRRRSIPSRRSGIEELVYDLKKDYTIVIVTHNMQQAARSRLHRLLLAGKARGVRPTEKLFTAPAEQLTEDYVTGRFG